MQAVWTERQGEYMTGPSNFAFLVEHSTLLADLGATAERLYPFDPSSCVLKLRLLAEAITRDIAARVGVVLVQPTQAELLRAVDARLGMDAQVRQLFHLLRRTGNAAAHEVQHGIGYREGLEALRVARELAVWFHRTFGSNPSFQPGPFRLPDDPSQKLATLQQRLELAEAANQRYAALHAEFESRLSAQAQRTTQSVGSETLAGYTRRAAEAATHLQMDEATTRLVIDLQLIEAGWDADTTRITHASGARPERGRYKAIAEWPMGGRQSADYLLFAGLTPIAVVEAKRQNIQVAGKIGQAERYARSHVPDANQPTAWQQEGRTEPWPDGQGAHFHIPFVYSSNGRPQVKQLAEVSGTWFRDVRAPSNTARSLPGFHSPQGLLDLLQRSREEAETRLQAEPYGYLQLRDYQVRAIGAVEAALADNRRNCLLAMATGTGKT
ncbi:MAG: type restriction-modification system endonuclease, partial [Pseudomonadota bacterium]